MEQRTEEWYEVRLGKVGASEIAKIINKKKDGSPNKQEEDLLIQKVAERLTGKRTDTYINQAMQNGIDREPDARKLYELVTKKKVEEVGFMHHPNIGWSGCSPDAIFDLENGNENAIGVLEIKCPSDTTHTKTLMDKKLPSQYKPQVQFQMACTGAIKADFVSYNPNFEPKQQMVLVEVARDNEYIEKMEASLKEFLTKVDDMVNEIKEK
jgi:putative phage-type endonuclease